MIKGGVARRQSPQRPQRKGFPTGGWVERGRTGTRRDRTPFPIDVITEPEMLPLDVDPDGQDDGHNPLPTELLLDSEGCFVVKEPVEDARLPEDGLAGEDR